MKYTVEASDAHGMAYNDDDSLSGSSASIINTDEELIKKAFPNSKSMKMVDIFIFQPLQLKIFI